MYCTCYVKYIIRSHLIASHLIASTLISSYLMSPQNRNQLQLKEGVSLKEAHDAEMDFFRSHNVFKKVTVAEAARKEHTVSAAIHYQAVDYP